MNTAFAAENTVAAGGMVHISQGFKRNQYFQKPKFHAKAIIKYQIIAYLTDFYLYKTTQQHLKSIVVIAGAFGPFKTDILRSINGFNKSVGEDMEITLRLQQYLKKHMPKGRVLFVPKAICYTQCPPNT